MPTKGRPAGAAGRAPRTERSVPSRARRSRAALPSRAAAGGSPRGRRARRATLTARAVILAVALASVALALALPFKIWVAQRGQIHALEAQTRDQERRVADLRHQQQQWQDPAYVEQQARLRLHYAMPGETSYIVLGRPAAPKPAARRPHPSAAPATTGPWFSRLWQTVAAAGEARSTSR